MPVPIPVQVILPNGQEGTNTITDVCYDVDLEEQLKRAFRFNPDFVRDCKRSLVPTIGPLGVWSDFQDGDVMRSKVQMLPLVPTGQNQVQLGFMFYYDGLGINNPIGPFHNNHNMGMCYVIVINLNPSHRLALHNIFLMTVAEVHSYENWPSSHLVYGKPGDGPDSKSFGMTMRRYPPSSPQTLWLFCAGLSGVCRCLSQISQQTKDSQTHLSLGVASVLPLTHQPPHGSLAQKNHAAPM